MIGSYATLGRYDFVVILDCPELETCMRILNREAAGGNIRYETMPALPTREFARLFLDEAQLAEETRVLLIGRSAARRASKTATGKAPAKAAGATQTAKAAEATKGDKAAKKSTKPKTRPSVKRPGSRTARKR